MRDSRWNRIRFQGQGLTRHSRVRRVRVHILFRRALEFESFMFHVSDPDPDGVGVVRVRA